MRRFGGCVKRAVVLIAATFAVACSDDGIEEFEDRTGSEQDNPAEFPKAVGAWIEARTFMMEQENSTGCDQVDFRVMASSGVFSVNRCDKTQSGQLTAGEFKRLDRIVTEAYEKTESNFCPEVFRFNKYYASINATDDENDRNFDPDNSCFSGDITVVQSYKNYLRQLLDKYSDERP